MRTASNLQNVKKKVLSTIKGITSLREMVQTQIKVSNLLAATLNHRDNSNFSWMSTAKKNHLSNKMKSWL